MAKPARSKAMWLGALVSVVGAGFLIWRVSFRDLAVALRSATPIWFLPAFAVFLMMLALRAWRWGVLLGGTPFATTFHANVIGYFFNSTLPLRLGEVARAYVIARKTEVTVARALSAVLVERLIDLASVLVLFAGFAQIVPMQHSLMRAATVGSIAVIVGVVSAAVLVVKGDAIIEALRPRLERLGNERALAGIARFRDIRDGFRAIGSPRRAAATLLSTVVIWGLTIAIAWLALRAFLPAGTFAEGGLVVVFSNLGGALPSAPGGLGVVQTFATSALVLPFGVADGDALAFVLVWSLSQQLLLVLIGLFSLGRVGLTLSEIRKEAV